MAAQIRQELGTEAQVVQGDRGEFSVWVNGRRVAKRMFLFGVPSDARMVRAVRGALQRG